MLCTVCEREASIFEGLTMMKGKRCHIACKNHMNRQWRKMQGLDKDIVPYD